MIYIQKIFNLLKKYTYEFCVDFSSDEMVICIKSLFTLHNGFLRQIKSNKNEVVFTTTNENWKDIIKDVLCFADVIDIKEFELFGVKDFVVRLRLKLSSNLVQRYAISMQNYLKDSVNVNDNKIIINSDHNDLLTKMKNINLNNNSFEFNNHVLICSGYITGEKMLNDSLSEKPGKLTSNSDINSSELNSNKHLDYNGLIQNGDTLKYDSGSSIFKQLNSVQIEKVLLSNQFSDFIDHIESNKNVVILSLRPNYFKLLCKYFEAYPEQKIMVVVNGNVYNMPMDFVTRDGMVSCRLVCSIDTNSEIFRQLHSGFFKVSFVKMENNEIDYNHVLFVVCLLLVVFLFVFFIIKQRRKALRYLSQSLLTCVFFSSINLPASLLILIFTYLASLLGDFIVFIIFISSFSAYMFIENVLFLSWSWLIMCQCLLFFSCLVLSVLVPSDDKL